MAGQPFYACCFLPERRRLCIERMEFKVKHERRERRPSERRAALGDRGVPDEGCGRGKQVIDSHTDATNEHVLAVHQKSGLKCI